MDSSIERELPKRAHYRIQRDQISFRDLPQRVMVHIKVEPEDLTAVISTHGSLLEPPDTEHPSPRKRQRVIDEANGSDVAQIRQEEDSEEEDKFIKLKEIFNVS